LDTLNVLILFTLLKQINKLKNNISKPQETGEERGKQQLKKQVRRKKIK
jgi:hypothetical protein